MYSRFDFISKETGKVLLSTLFDAPPMGIDKTNIPLLIRKLKAAKKSFEEVFGEGQVRVSLDGWETSVFWAAVMYRPVYFRTSRSVGGTEKMSLYGILKNRGSRVELRKTNLGAIYDRERHFLVLDWKDAVKEDGILHGIDSMPSWQTIQRRWEKRMAADGDNADPQRLLRLAAESHSWVVPRWVLEKSQYLKNKLWFRVGLAYEDITVLDLRGLPMVHLESEGKGLLNEATTMVSKTAKFVYHYTEDVREFKNVYKLQKKSERPKETPEQRRRRLDRARLRRKGVEPEAFPDGRGKTFKKREDIPYHRNAYDAARLICEIPKWMGKGYPGVYPYTLTHDEHEKRLNWCVDAFLNGELDRPKWDKVEYNLDRLERLFGQEGVLEEFEEWQIFRNQGEGVPDYIQRKHDHE